MSQLKKIKRQNLDLEKYSRALNDSINYRIYAEHWYLDLLTNEKWECWVWGDYEVIMPIPLQYKFGIKFVLQPIYCQQLGVFYKEEISDELFKEFEKKLHKYRVRAYHFNEENTERYEPEGVKRVNYVLDLDRPYEEIFKGYKSNRRSDLKKSVRLEIKIKKDSNKANYIELFKTNYGHLGHLINESFLQKYMDELDSRNRLLVFDVLDNKDRLIASQLGVISKDRNIYMGFVRNKEIENHNASAFAMDSLIKEWAGNKKWIDFEGSNNPKIAGFMLGFKPICKHYVLFSNFKFSATDSWKKVKSDLSVN